MIPGPFPIRPASGGDNNGGVGPVAPTGTIVAFGGTVAPDTWAFCDASEVSRATYAALFNVIGEAFGAGDGTTTFLLPSAANCVLMGQGGLVDLGRFVGEATHTLLTTEMPSHTHNGPAHTHGITSNNFDSHDVGSNSDIPLTFGGGGTTMGATESAGDGATSSAGTDGAHNNLQPSLGVNFIIKL